MLRLCESLVGRLLVAEHQHEGDVAVRIVVPHLRRAILRGVADQRHRGERLVVDLDHVGGVARLRLRLGHHEGDAVADEAHLLGLQHLLENAMALGRADVFRHQAGRERTEMIGSAVRAGQHQHDAGRGLRLRHVDLPDARMRVRGEQVDAVAHAGKHDVVHVTSRAGEETRILDAPHRLPDSEFGHMPNVPSLPSRAGRYGGLGARAIAATSRYSAALTPL